MALEWLHDRTEEVGGEALLRGALVFAEQKRLEDATRDAEEFLYRSRHDIPFGHTFRNAAQAITFNEGRAEFKKFVDRAPTELLWNIIERALKAKIVQVLLEVERDPDILATQYESDGRFGQDVPRFNLVLADVCARLSVVFTPEEAEATARAVNTLMESDYNAEMALEVAASLLTNLNLGFGPGKPQDAVVVSRSPEGVTLRFNKSQYIPDY